MEQTCKESIGYSYEYEDKMHITLFLQNKVSGI